MEPNKAKRTLRFYSKVRSGCLTCKKRKVKCDEAKPHCRRCTGTGRLCEGYRPDRASSPMAVAANPASQTGLFASPVERRSFMYFQSQACKPLGGKFNSSFWGREVMQAAIHYHSIRHLVIALGAAYEMFEAGTLGQETQLTLQHSNYAIRQLATLNQAPDAPSAEATCCILTASVLFIYLASIQGRFLEAFQHVRSATKVLQDFERSSRQDPNASPTASPTYPIPVSQLRSLLASAYAQLRGMLNDVFLEVGSHDILVTEMKPATVFTSVQEAHAYVERLHQNTLAYLQASDFRPRSDEALAAAVARHRELCQALESSQNALDFLIKGLSKSDEADSEESIAILRVYHLLMAIWLRIDIFHPGDREVGYDAWDDHFEEILRLCEFIVHKQQQAKIRWGQPSCSSGLGYIMPLHMVAARCRNARVRWRAVELLSACPRREALWDAHLAGKVAAQAIKLEEQASNLTMKSDAEVLPGKRVHEVKVEMQGEETATVRFITVDDWKQGRCGTVKQIKL
ncbi:hypothetical protein C7999DRAFT_17307 [Corynascus novoguineensis]|uniref:Zn(2)-C6 fungal-type domain-containing protein n=1 Tax=Corynascus novoguineensis TaxID=1126955 RepID=A0AAN7CLR8_9PEZI|nr:hypothetical protein C7999DRAFT_17307 [Corynascus novoguineensis]